MLTFSNLPSALLFPTHPICEPIPSRVLALRPEEQLVFFHVSIHSGGAALHSNSGAAFAAVQLLIFRQHAMPHGIVSPSESRVTAASLAASQYVFSSCLVPLCARIATVEGSW